jgi:predicted glycosyltransferase
MSEDFLAEDYRFTADLLREYDKRGEQVLFRAVCSNNLAIILAALDIAEAVAAKSEAET